MSAIREVFANNASSTLAAAIASTTVTSISVNSATPFPTTGNFRIIIDNEIMLVTAVSGTTFTVVRGAEGTTAATHLVNATVTHIVTVGSHQLFVRDNVPFADDTGRNPLRLQDTSGNILTSSGFTVVNGTTATITAENSGPITIVKSKQTSGGEDFTFLTRTAPSTPYSVVAALDGILPDPTDYSSFGLGFRESSTGKLSTIVLAMNGGSTYPCCAVYNFNSPTNFSGSIVGRFLCAFGAIKWFKVSDDGTNLTFYVSHSGTVWVQIAQVSRTSFMSGGPDQVGWGINSSYNTSYGTAVSLLSWFGA